MILDRSRLNARITRPALDERRGARVSAHRFSTRVNDHVFDEHAVTG